MDFYGRYVYQLIPLVFVNFAEFFMCMSLVDFLHDQ